LKGLQNTVSFNGKDARGGGDGAKIIAANIATGSGVDTIITNGVKINLLKDIILGKEVGAIFLVLKKHLEAKKS
jgi:glutamate 5-kinase